MFTTNFSSCGDVKLHNKIVRINSAHLASYFLFPDSAQGYVGKRRVAKKIFIYKNHVQERLREVEVLHDVQAAKIRRVLDTSSHPNIYCGDMNATSCMYSYKLLKGSQPGRVFKERKRHWRNVLQHRSYSAH